MMPPSKICCFLSGRLMFTLLLFLFPAFSFSQGKEATLNDNSAFNRALPGNASRKVTKVEKQFRKASSTMDKAANFKRQINDIHENSRRAKTRKVSKLEEKKMQKEIEAFYIYQQAHKKLYTLYRKSLKQFREQSTTPDEGIRLEKDATVAYKKSKKFRRKAENKGDIEEAYALFTDAYGFEIDAINHQINAFSHYQPTAPLPVTEASPEEDIAATDSIAETIPPEPETDSLTAEEPELPLEELPDTVAIAVDNVAVDESVADTLAVENISTPLLLVATEEKADSLIVTEVDTMAIEEEQGDTVATDTALTTPVVEPESPPMVIFFTIQILSRASPATDEQLAQFYSGPGKPYLMKNDGYYRYVVGRFDTLFEAKVFQNQNQVEGFIVAYKNGEKIPVQEAVDLLKEQ